MYINNQATLLIRMSYLLYIVRAKWFFEEKAQVASYNTNIGFYCFSRKMLAPLDAAKDRIRSQVWYTYLLTANERQLEKWWPNEYVKLCLVCICFYMMTRTFASFELLANRRADIARALLFVNKNNENCCFNFITGQILNVYFVHAYLVIFLILH